MYKRNDIESTKHSRLKLWTGYAACVWAVHFAAAHYYWTFGGIWLLDITQVKESRQLLAERPWYYWTSWLTLSTIFVLTGLFPLALARSPSRSLPRWLRFSLVWLTGTVLLLLAASLFVADNSLWSSLPFLLCALGLVLVQRRYRTVPGWVLFVATWTLGIAMMGYGALGISFGSLWGGWWLGGGALFTATAWCHTRQARSSGVKEKGRLR
jgi:hypothetical protein